MGVNIKRVDYRQDEEKITIKILVDPIVRSNVDCILIIGENWSKSPNSYTGADGAQDNGRKRWGPSY